MNMKISNDKDLATIKNLLESQLQEAEKFKGVRN